MSDINLAPTPQQALDSAVTQEDFILLDRTGSMRDQWTEALGAVNAYVKKLADENVPTKVTCACFDQNHGKFCFDVLRQGVEPRNWADLTNADAQPRGMTPLNDAIGQIASLAQKANPSKCVIIIMTDGEENSSAELTVTQAQKLLQDCRNKGWQVLFLGANFDNIKQAASYGSGIGQTAAFAPSGLAGATRSMGATRAAYSTGEAATMDWAEDEKEKLGDITKKDGGLGSGIEKK